MTLHVTSLLRPSCVPVRLSVGSHISKTTRPNLTEFFVHVTCGRGSVFLGRHCNTLCASGFVDDVIYSHDGDNGPKSGTTLCLVQFAR